jgi:hypothetical protein
VSNLARNQRKENIMSKFVFNAAVKLTNCVYAAKGLAAKAAEQTAAVSKTVVSATKDAGGSFMAGVRHARAAHEYEGMMRDERS